MGFTLIWLSCPVNKGRILGVNVSDMYLCEYQRWQWILSNCVTVRVLCFHLRVVIYI